MIIGYARVSTKEQNIELQIKALEKAGAELIYKEKISALKERAALKELLIFARSGDTIIVWKLDRIARSLKHLISIVENLKERGIEFISITENIDTATPLGSFFLHITGAFAELERNLIVERTKAGLKIARDQGRIGGRRKGLSKNAKNKAKAAKKLYLSEERNQTVEDICKLLGIGSKATFYRYLRSENVIINRNKKK